MMSLTTLYIFSRLLPSDAPYNMFPPEILRRILKEPLRRDFRRRNVISLALVCRSWEIPALENLCENFHVARNGPKLVDIFKTLKITHA